MNIIDYGFDYNMISDSCSGIPARITSVHKGRFGIVSDYGEGFAQLKGTQYYFEDGVFPTVGDFVLIDYNRDGDSRIIKTLERRTFFHAVIRTRAEVNRQLPLILTMCSLCSR